MITATDEVHLTLRGPLITKSTGIGGFGLDAVMASSRDKYIIAYSHIKGKIREAWQEFAAAGHPVAIDEWLGTGTGNRQTPGRFDPSRGRIQFTDLIHEIRNAPGTRVRIKINEQTGAAEDGTLLFIEAPFLSGEEIIFTGRIRFLAQDEAQLALMRTETEKALQWIATIGAEQTVGYGRVVTGRIEPTAQGECPRVEGLRLALTFSEPFCVTSRRTGRNGFISDEIIPGGVLRGAIAEFIQHGGFPKLRDLFHLVRITHAFPSIEDRRPQQMPLSFYKLNGQLLDAALATDCPNTWNEPLAFSVDWKENTVRSLLGWPNLSRELRVRTAIAGDQRKAKDEHLFAYEMIVPKHGVSWLASVDLSRVPSQDVGQVQQELGEALSRGIFGIGKTKAHAAVSAGPVPDVLIPEPVGNHYVVTLQTPVLLVNPSDIQDWQDKDQALNAYQKAWEQLLPGCKLVRTFQSMSLSGGDYLYHRFQESGPDGKYRPYLLTDSGSVFVFEAAGIDPANLQEIISYGMNVPSETLRFYLGGEDIELGRLWTRCPFIPENGYGEIVVNVPLPQPEDH